MRYSKYMMPVRLIKAKQKYQLDGDRINLQTSTYCTVKLVNKGRGKQGVLVIFSSILPFCPSFLLCFVAADLHMKLGIQAYHSRSGLPFTTVCARSFTLHRQILSSFSHNTGCTRCHSY